MKCICQMCDCGKHRCPHFIKQKPTKVTRKEPCNVTTEYKGEFLKTNGGSIVRQRPTDCIKSEGNVNFDTTHRNTFTAHKIERSPPKKTAETKYERAGEPMSGDTEYAKNYLNEKAQIPRQASYLKKKTKLYTASDDYNEVSVTQQDFDTKKVNERTQMKKLSDNHVASTAPFEQKSVHQADYTKFNEPPSKTGRRPDNLNTRGQPRYFDTTSRSHYITHANKQEIWKKPRQVYEPSIEPFTGSSLMHSDFGVHKDPIRSAPVPHNNYLFATNEPIQNKTTNLSSYRNWGVQNNSSISTKEVSLYRPPSKKMDLQKTSDDYKDFRGMKPSKKLRPKTNISFGGDFGGESMYTSKFVKHDVTLRAKPIIIREQTTDDSPRVPFGGCSESKDHYKKFDTSPAKMVKRINDIFGKDSAFDGNTSYMDQYVTKKIPKCPMLEKINTNFTGYNISDDIENGHRFLEKTSNCSITEPTLAVANLPPIITA